MEKKCRAKGKERVAPRYIEAEVNDDAAQSSRCFFVQRKFFDNFFPSLRCTETERKSFIDVDAYEDYELFPLTKGDEKHEDEKH